MTIRTQDEAFVSVGHPPGGDPAYGKVLGYVDGATSGDRDWIRAVLTAHGGEIPSAAAFVAVVQEIAARRGEAVHVIEGGEADVQKHS